VPAGQESFLEVEFGEEPQGGSDELDILGLFNLLICLSY